MNCIKKSLLPKNVTVIPSGNSVQLFNGEMTNVTGEIDLNINFGLTNMNIKALVVDNLSFGFIIGTVNIKTLQLTKINNQFDVVLNGSKLETQILILVLL